MKDLEGHLDQTRKPYMFKASTDFSQINIYFSKDIDETGKTNYSLLKSASIIRNWMCRIKMALILRKTTLILEILWYFIIWQGFEFYKVFGMLT